MILLAWFPRNTITGQFAFLQCYVALRFEGGRGDGDGKGMEWLEHIETNNESICSLAGRELYGLGMEFCYTCRICTSNGPKTFRNPLYRCLLRGNLNRLNWRWWCYVPSTVLLSLIFFLHSRNHRFHHNALYSWTNSLWFFWLRSASGSKGVSSGHGWLPGVTSQ